MLKVKTLLLLGAALLLAGHSVADDDFSPDGAFSAARYRSLWVNSPFALETETAPSPDGKYQLVGLAVIDHVGCACLMERNSERRIFLVAGVAAGELKLISINFTSNGSATSASVENRGTLSTLPLEIGAAVVSQGPPPDLAFLPPGGAGDMKIEEALTRRPQNRAGR